MKKRRTLKYFLAGFSIFCFAASFILWFFYVKRGEETVKHSIVKSIQNRILQEISKAEKQTALTRITLDSAEVPSFKSLLEDKNYPYYIFRNKNIFFWSDNTIQLKYERLNGSYHTRLIDLKNGKYLSIHDRLRKRGDEFDLFVLIPIEYKYSIENNYIHSGLNEELFANPFVEIINTPAAAPFNIHAPDGSFLFSVGFKKDFNSPFLLVLIIVLIFAGILAEILSCVLFLPIDKYPDQSLLGLFVFLAGIKAVLYVTQFPFVIYDLELFNPKNFASSALAASMGDLLINGVLIFIFFYLFFRKFYCLRSFRFLSRQNRIFKLILATIAILLSGISYSQIYHIVKIIYIHSPWQLDITAGLDASIYKIISFFIFILISGIFFMASHILLRVYYNFSSGLKERIVILGIGMALFAAAEFLFGYFNLLLFFVFLVYVSVVVFFKFFKSLNNLSYNTYIYFIVACIASSTAASFSVYKQSLHQEVIEKEDFAEGIRTESDVLAEYLLHEISISISEDVFIKNILISPFTSKELIIQKIKKAYLPKYLDKFDVSINLYDAEGGRFFKTMDSTSFDSLAGLYKTEQFKTDFANIYVAEDKEHSGLKKYISFVEINRGSFTVGHLMIELKQKRIIPNSVYPELLVDRKYLTRASDKDYSYALFSGKDAVYSYGIFNYQKDFKSNFLNNPDLYQEGIYEGNFHHFGLKDENGKVIVVSSEAYPFAKGFSNFSFFFLLLIIVVLIVTVGTTLYYQSSNINTSFATKIQIYLNIAFLLPLIIVSIVTLSVMSRSYREHLNDSFLKKADLISSTIAPLLNAEDLRDNEASDNLISTIIEISKHTGSDINLYNNKGKLIISNQPLIYESGIVSRLLNPRAYEGIIESRNNTMLLSEKAGSLNFNAAFVGIRSSETGELLAVLSLPFFHSTQELETQVIEVLTTIINIFVSIFIILILLSYFASRQLLYPLNLIRQRIRKTTLEQNEPIEWKSQDEIGMLVDEYNEMLKKLEESRDKLSKSEKESAWREMAQQVAHEIKNPLTPMKLTIQHLQRNIKENEPGLTHITLKPLNTLLDQVNNLNEIASSFSMFAKMPVPQSEKFDLSPVLQSTVNLHNNTGEADVETHIAPGVFEVMGDSQLMRNLFNNLIINAIQAVEEGKHPKLIISLEKHHNSALVQIKDNGKGIPEHIRSKVFFPNFTTKETGSGIGLAVAKRGVEHAGGKIWFETSDHDGTTFFVEIPLIL